MIDVRALAMPWAPSRQLYCAPGRVVMKLALGEAPDWIPTVRDVRTGYLAAAQSLDGGGRLDHILSHFSDSRLITRVHGAAASRHRFGSRHLAYDDAEHAFGMSRTFRVTLDRDASIDDVVDALRQAHIVEAASPHYLCVQSAAPVAPERPSFADAWASRQLVHAPEALAQESGDPTIIVAIVDTGVQLQHPEFVGRLRAGFDTVQLGPADLAAGLNLVGDLVDEDMEPDDEVGHGTGCAGIIGARGSGIPRGLGGDATVLPLRVLGSASMPGKEERVGVGALPDIDDGLKRAIDLRAVVLNLSFGTPLDTLDEHDPVPHLDVVRYGLARGCVMVAASGNSGRAERFSPACLEGVIAVGSVNDEGRQSPFSTRGEHVAISAPGERVVSAGLGGVARLTGTSFAAPFVTATAALLLARANKRSVPLDAARVRQVLRASARPFTGPALDGYGAGILDAAAALRALDAEFDGQTPPQQSLS